MRLAKIGLIDLVQSKLLRSRSSD